MALQQLPVTDSTIQVVHSGPTDGTAFSTTLDASDGAPMAPQQIFTFDLNVFAPDMIDTTPMVGVFRDPSGEQVEVDIEVTSEQIKLTFFEAVEPEDYRIKAVG